MTEQQHVYSAADLAPMVPRQGPSELEINEAAVKKTLVEAGVAGDQPGLTQEEINAAGFKKALLDGAASDGEQVMPTSLKVSAERGIVSYPRSFDALEGGVPSTYTGPLCEPHVAHGLSKEEEAHCQRFYQYLLGLPPRDFEEAVLSIDPELLAKLDQLRGIHAQSEALNDDDVNGDEHRGDESQEPDKDAGQDDPGPEDDHKDDMHPGFNYCADNHDPDDAFAEPNEPQERREKRKLIALRLQKVATDMILDDAERNTATAEQLGVLYDVGASYRLVRAALSGALHKLNR